MLKKIVVGASTTVVAVLLAASPALAHFCSVKNRSATANAAVLKNSQNWMTFREAAPLFVCPAGAAWFIAEADTLNLDIDTPFNLHATMGGGAVFVAGKQPAGISYAFELFPLFEQADAICNQA